MEGRAKARGGNKEKEMALFMRKNGVIEAGTAIFGRSLAIATFFWIYPFFSFFSNFFLDLRGHLWYPTIDPLSAKTFTTRC